MDIHENARTTRHGRMLMIERLHAGWPVAADPRTQRQIDVRSAGSVATRHRSELYQRPKPAAPPHARAALPANGNEIGSDPFKQTTSLTRARRSQDLLRIGRT
jgi:hypothetical protein